MNFVCGSDYGATLDQATTKVASATLCGPCVKEGGLDSLLSYDEEDELISRKDGRKDIHSSNESHTFELIKNNFSDNVQASLWNLVPREGTPTSNSRRCALLSNVSPPADNQRLDSTPSPIYLNPMVLNEWNSESDSTGIAKFAVLHPEIEPSSKFVKFSDRLKKGFRVHFLQNVARTISGRTATPSLLFLDDLNRLLCISYLDDESESGNPQRAPDCTIPVDKILGLDTNGRDAVGSPHCSDFSIIASLDSRLCYYDFEVQTSLERELIVSALLVVLNQLQRQAVGVGNVIIDHADKELDGTFDRLTLCSPFLEHHCANAIRDDTESSSRSVIHQGDKQTRSASHSGSRRFVSRLPRTRIENYRSRSSSPATVRQASEGYGSMTKQINSSNKYPFSKSRLRQTTQEVLLSPNSSPEVLSLGSVASPYGGLFEPPVIPEVSSSNKNMSSTLRSRASFTGSEDSLQPSVEDLIVEFAASGHLSPWCADDACTLAFNDLADSCSNIFASSQPSSKEEFLESTFDQQRMLEEYIASAIGAPSAFYSYLTEGRRWNSVSHHNDPTILASTRIRNRSSVRNAQARRLRSLRGEMTFSTVFQKSQEIMPYVQTVRSFCDATSYRKQTKQVTEEGAIHFHSSSLFQHVVGSTKIKTEFPEEHKLAFYDSDPEDARSHSLYRKCPRQLAVRYKNKSRKVVSTARETVDTGFSNIQSIRRVSRRLEEDVIVQIVQTMTNDRLTLIWHPTQAIGGTNQSPLCVKVWIESGVCLFDGTFVLPKLSWLKLLDSSESETGLKSGRKLHSTEPYYVELLDVCRVYGVETVDRKLYPYANVRKSFIVETQSDSYMFETQTAEERDRIIYGLKLVIARLASMLMLRDARAAEEFFGAVATSVPGEAPGWLQGSTRDANGRISSVLDE